MHFRRRRPRIQFSMEIGTMHFHRRRPRIQLSMEIGAMHCHRRSPGNLRLSDHWLRNVRESVSQQSEDIHKWFKSRPANADWDKAAERMWYEQKPSVRKSRTGPDAKQHKGHEFGARIGAAIGKLVGVPVTPHNKACSAASNAQEYRCRQCGYKTTMQNVKRAMPAHLGRAENKKCLDHYSQSLDAREKLWIKLVHEPAIGAECRKCGYTTTQRNAKRNMVAHLKRSENKECLKLYSDSTVPREMDWVRAVQSPV